MKKQFLSMALVLIMALSLVFAVTVTVSADVEVKNLHIDFPAGGTYSLQTWLYINNEEIDWNTWPNPVNAGTVWDTTTKVNQQVTVYVTPDAGNKAVVTVNGEQVALVDGKVSFVMDEDKSVVVSYVPDVPDVKDFILNIGEGGSVSVQTWLFIDGAPLDWNTWPVSRDPGVHNLATKVNEPVTLHITPNKGNKAVVTINGEPAEVIDGKVSFVMDEDKSVVVSYEPDVKDFILNIAEGGSVSVQTYLFINGEVLEWDPWPVSRDPGVHNLATKVDEPVTLHITPNKGNKAVVTVNGEQVEVIDGKASFVMDEDKNVVVSYVPAVYSVSFDIGAGGSLYVTGNAYSSSEDKYYEWFDQNLGTNTTSNYSFASGQTLTMTLVPDSGKKAVAYVDGVEVPVAADNTVSFVNNANTSFKVEFIDIPSSVTAGAPVTSPNYAAIIDGKSYTSAYSIVMYGNVVMNGSEVLKECGYRITMLDEEGNAKGDALTLKAVGGLSDNGDYAIRGIGAALVKGSYSVQPYMITEAGNEYTDKAKTVTLE